MDEWNIDGFLFQDRKEYENALKEKDTITVLKNKVNLQDGKNALKVYNRFVKEDTFRTIYGFHFLAELRESLIESGFVTEDMLAPISVQERKASLPPVKKKKKQEDFPEEGKYEQLYKDGKANIKKFKIAIVALVVILVAMFVITIKSQYSVFTYFTDYKTKMEEELVNKYETWEKELDQREAELDK